MSRTEVNNSQNIIDSRDVIARIRELESDMEGLINAITEANTSLADFVPEDGAVESNEANLENLQDEVRRAEEALADWDDATELAALLSLRNEADGCSDWQHGEPLIRESYFETYARELAEDVCDMKQADKWPFNCIDWARAENELAQDYTTVDFDGVDYLIRS